MFVENLVKFSSNQEGIKSNKEFEGEIIESIVEIKVDMTGYNVEKMENGTKQCLHSV